jgi:acetylornithine deacetylase/succinyl-diaminopimelate desuccinylase-like protein
MLKRIVVLFIAVLTSASALAQNDPTEKLARDILTQLVAIKTTESGVGSTPAAEAMAKRLLDAGFPPSDVILLGSTARKENLIARIHGTGKEKPILLLAHLDVVEAPRADWSTDPFQLTEKDGYLYGRGSYDVKSGDAILMANFIRWHQQGFKPDRDIIMALTADEEMVLSKDNGVKWLTEHRRDLIDAAYCLNTDGGDFVLKPNGQPLLASIQQAEKWYVDWTLQVVNPGGHSSRPRKDNAIYELATALLGIQKLEFPAQPDQTVRAYFDKSASLESGQLADDMRAVAKEPPDAAALARLSENPFYNALLRTTCVATEIQGGHAANALPQVATANVNCRVLPEMKLAEVQDALTKAINDPNVKLSLVEQPTPGPASPPNAEVTNAVEKVVSQMWPGTPVIPSMETGATDGKWLRMAGIPTYGVSGVFMDPAKRRPHGKDENVGVREFYWGVDFYDKVVKAIAQ